ncbi:MAG: hypothetical protein CSA22_01015 [Deltaproteobacteria bacterium]|nr:MAG: hypothetical protein CSA22_01015 [Deltaproteobacteria bacterium]
MNPYSDSAPPICLGIFTAVFIWTGIRPASHLIWFLYALPALAALAAILFTYHRFPLTRISYFLILFYCVIQLISGHFMCADIPVLRHVQNALDLPVENSTRFTYLVNGFVPAVVLREILIRKQVVNGMGWLFSVVVSFTLSIHIMINLLKWWAAQYLDFAVIHFFQQEDQLRFILPDSAMVLCGAIIALLILEKAHDNEIHAISSLRRNRHE